jgi:hypothetical protein
LPPSCGQTPAIILWLRQFLNEHEKTYREKCQKLYIEKMGVGDCIRISKGGLPVCLFVGLGAKKL